jgi:hypothetical protein
MTPGGGLHSIPQSAWDTRRLWSLWDMLLNYFPIYEITLQLQTLRASAELFNAGKIVSQVNEWNSRGFQELLDKIRRECPTIGLTQPAEIAESVSNRSAPVSYSELIIELNHLSDSFRRELQKELIFRIPPERKNYIENDSLFGSGVSVAFPSCARDIRKAGDCYAFAQEDACVHHLMLVLERGLNALAAKVGVPYQRTNWQNIIEQVAKKVKSLPSSPEKDFYLEVNAQFGFLKDAYRNHAEHARDDHYDMPKALSILNHVCDFMQELAEGGLSE